MTEINKYELDEDVTIEKLVAAGFIAVTNGNQTSLVFCRELITDIDLYVEFDITKSQTITFDEEKCVSVIDDEIGQYYSAFYRRVNSDFVERTTRRYNEVMNSLVNKGILKHKQLEDKQLKKIK